MAHEEGRVANAGPGRKGVPKYRYTWSRPRRNTYLPTYLVRVPSHSLTPAVSPSFSCPRVPIASLLPLPILEPHRALLVAGACVSYTAGSPRHDARHRATTGTDQWFVSPRRRRASRRRRRPLSLFFSFSLPFSLPCYPVARARNLAERVHSSCWLLVLEARSSKRFQDPLNLCGSNLEFKLFKIDKFLEHWVYDRFSFYEFSSDVFS